MSAIQRIVREAGRIPAVSKLGFAVIVLGLAADIVVHLTPGASHDHAGANASELSAHFIVFVGMAIVLVGVIADGVRSRPATESVKVQGRDTDAVR
jgi:hypothetical protein